jgi:RND family efflux transporter MFP subunit
MRTNDHSAPLISADDTALARTTHAPAASDHATSAPPQRKRGRWPLFLAFVAVLAAGALYAMGTLPRIERDELLAREADAVKTRERVFVLVKPDVSKASYALTLPGSARAFQEAVIFARTDGYLRGWSVDIGDKVEEGQVLAEIEAPDVDASLNEARARLEEARANHVLAEATLVRWKSLADTKAVSPQQIDDETARSNTAASAEKVAEAVVHRLTTDQAYQHVVAPFSGTITARYVDKGALITGGSGPNATRLFAIAQTDTLRIGVQVPESAYLGIASGADVEVRVIERPGTVFHGKVSRTAGAVDPSSRTMKVEVAVPNADGRLVAGAFVETRFAVQRTHPAVIVPATALVLRADGVKLVVVGADDVAHFVAVKIGRDLGKELEIIEGLTGDERIVQRPSDQIHEGDRIKAAPPSTP